MKSEDYRSYLVECVKAAGQMIIDMADDIVGETDVMTNLALEVSFDQENRSIPEITITRTYLPELGYKVKIINKEKKNAEN